MTRDPAHCLDLLTKDLGKLPTMAPFLSQISALVTLLSNGNIVGCCEATVAQGKVPAFVKVVKKSETRFHGVADEINSIYKNRQLLTLLPTLINEAATRCFVH